MSAPVNVKLEHPTITLQQWKQEATEWMKLNASIEGNSDFYPLTVKAAYVIGIIYDQCESVSYLLTHPNARAITYIPAYGVFASGVEILGRCVNGNPSTRGSTGDLKAGFKWLVDSFYHRVPDTHVLITTDTQSYTIEDLAALRHFAAHGQATSAATQTGTYRLWSIDYGILSKMPPLIADGLERYWSQLQVDEILCNQLAKANVVALRKWPVFRSWTLFERDESGKYRSVTEIFNDFKWCVYS